MLGAEISKNTCILSYTIFYPISANSTRSICFSYHPQLHQVQPWLQPASFCRSERRQNEENESKHRRELPDMDIFSSMNCCLKSAHGGKNPCHDVVLLPCFWALGKGGLLPLLFFLKKPTFLVHFPWSRKSGKSC